MCGIAGIVGRDATAARIAQIETLLRHRGPDDAGTFTAPGVALASTRLSIIDLDGGAQPMSAGDLAVVFNGEILNATELRAQLESRGYTFRTRCDTEILLWGYDAWGDDVLERLRGMFAFALWDGRRRRLMAAVDRFAIKPLYWAEATDHFALASEIKPLLSMLPELERRANTVALHRLFELGYIPAPLSPLVGISQLPAGHVLIYEDERVRTERYWEPRFPEARRHRRLSARSARGDLELRLREAVNAWRTSDVPVGSLLSGGVDSSLMAAMLTESVGDRIDTFHIRFDDVAYDESAHARAVANTIGSRHHEIRFSDQDFDLLPQIVTRLETPQCSATCVAVFRLYEACREHGLKVVLTGEGADELFAGYHWFVGDERARPLLKLPYWLRGLMAQAALNISSPARRVIAGANGDPVERYAMWHAFTTPDERSSLLKFSHSPLTDVWRTQHRAGLRGRTPLDQFLLLESQTRLPSFINTTVDRMSMASSVEARPPFLDHHLWEWATTLPPRLKLNGGTDKPLLREMAAKLLPASVTRRPKLGLATPHGRWWRTPRLPDWAEEAVSTRSLGQTGYFSSKQVARLRTEHTSGLRDHSRLLMGVLTTQLWHRAFLA